MDLKWLETRKRGSNMVRWLKILRLLALGYCKFQRKINSLGFINRMEMFMKDNGLMIKPMEKVLIFIKMVQDIKDNGKMIYSTDLVDKYG